MSLTSLIVTLSLFVVTALCIVGVLFYPNYFHQYEMRAALSRELAHERELTRVNH